MKRKPARNDLVLDQHGVDPVQRLDTRRALEVGVGVIDHDECAALLERLEHRGIECLHLGLRNVVVVLHRPDEVDRPRRRLDRAAASQRRAHVTKVQRSQPGGTFSAAIFGRPLREFGIDMPLSTDQG